MPLLTPYEAVSYVYISGKSALTEQGRLARVSTRGMQTDLVKSARSQGVAGNSISLQQVGDVLRSLDSLGATRKNGASTRAGTLYRVSAASREIRLCLQRAERIAEGFAPTTQPEVDLDYYSVAESRMRVHERDDYRCRYCSKQLTHQIVTPDHIVPISQGGGHDIENLVTACLDGNSKKNGRLFGDFLASVHGPALEEQHRLNG
ncbi:MAG: HNH endonuclease [Vulcanimicrobiaceae bacterium]